MSAANAGGGGGNDCCTVIKNDDEGYGDGNITERLLRSDVKDGCKNDGGRGKVIGEGGGGGGKGGGGALNYSMNVLLVYRLEEMRRMERINFMLAIACLTYCGINLALIVINYVDSISAEDAKPVPEKWCVACFFFVYSVVLFS